MKGLLLASVLGLAAARHAVSPQSNALLKNRHPELASAPTFVGQEKSSRATEDSSSSSKPLYLTKKTKPFAVDGKNIPEVDWDAGESYAGLLPISDKKDEEDKLFFWFFPTDNKDHIHDKEITVWLNGGPGCSSLLGFMQENGPILWPDGELKPLKNPWAFTKVTNMIWVEQPIGTGFSEGKVTITNEDELAEQFMGFWKNFFDTFDMHGWKVNIVSESYGGLYGPYISKHFLDAKNTTYYDLNGLIVIDAVLFDDRLQEEVITENYIKANPNLMPVDDATMTAIHNTSEHCGYNDFVQKYWTYPPAGPMPKLAPWNEMVNGSIASKPGCGDDKNWERGMNAMYDLSPCFNIYNIADRCPVTYNALEGTQTSKGYFNRADVKKAIHVPASANWGECSDKSVFANNEDTSDPSGWTVLPHVIDATQNVIVHMGALDYILPANGILLGLQNMTWGGKLGLQTAPSDPLYVPDYGYDDSKSPYGADYPAGFGVMGTTHKERGLTVAVAALAGHQAPEYTPGISLRELEYLLGRVKSLSEVSPFTFSPINKIKQPKGSLGKGTFPIPYPNL